MFGFCPGEKRREDACHWVHQGLIAISEVRGQPTGGVLYNFGGPLPVGKVKWLELPVLLGRVLEP